MPYSMAAICRGYCDARCAHVARRPQVPRSPPGPAPSSMPASSPAPTARALDSGIWTLFGAPRESRVRHAAGQERLTVRLDTGHRGRRLRRCHRDRDRRDVFRRRRDPLLDLLRHHHHQSASSTTSTRASTTPPAPSSSTSRTTGRCPSTPPRPATPTATPPTPTPRWAPTPPAGPSTASSWTSRRPDLHALEPRSSAADAWTPIKAAGRHRLRHPDALGHLRSPPPTARGGGATTPRSGGSTTSPTRRRGISDPDTTAARRADRPCRHPGHRAGRRLSWNANTEPDLSGYKVYRDGVLLTPVPIPARRLHRRAPHRRHRTPTPSQPSTPPVTRARARVSSWPPWAPSRRRTPARSSTPGSRTESTAPRWTPAPGRCSARPLRPSTTTPGPRTARSPPGYRAPRPPPTPVSSSPRPARCLQTAPRSASGPTSTPRPPDASSTTSTRASTTPPAPSSCNFQNNGALSVYTSKAGSPNGYTTNAYTPVGTYTTGWTQYRLVMDFTDQTYTLSSRVGATDAWTQLKAPGATGYAIPMLAAITVTATHGTRWRSYYAAQHVGRRHRLLGHRHHRRVRSLHRHRVAPVPAARSHLPAPPPSPTAPRRPTPSRRPPATRSPACSSTVSRSELLRSYTFTNVSAEPHHRCELRGHLHRRRHARHLRQLRQLPCAGQPARRARPPVRGLPRRS